jgi:type IV secretory pathway VirB10-like protein
MAESPEPPLIPIAAPQRRVDRRLVVLVLLVVGGVVLGLLMWMLPRGGKRELARLERAPSEDVGTGSLGLVGDPQRRTGSYEQLSIVPTTPLPRAEPAPLQPQGPSAPSSSFRLGDTAIPSRPVPPTPLTPPPYMPESNGSRPATTSTQTKPSDDPRNWLKRVVASRGDIAAPPFAEDPKTKDQPSKLFPKATWEKPKDPYKILYADQIVQGQLTQNISSDFPGTVRIKVTQAVEDRWGHGHVLIPLDTTFIGQQQGATNFGQTRLPVQITQAIFPDGTAVQWQKGQVGDQMGANGVPADVDNHYGKLLLGVGLQALLSIGVRAPFGSTQGFQQNLPQEFAQDASQGVNQAGQRIIQQQFSVKPTLSQEHGFPVTIAFLENVSFQTEAILVKQ